ncbi:MAG TPA: 4-phosphoerythronate dehydrogenase [Candidatus Acidoferrum sp.]|nr:4-phosphoerythronate dehydrogenase [Candidatus Acidoferrum sp.]
MRIVADENITAVRQSFARYGEVITLPGRSIDAVAVQDCDALLVRSVTKVTQALLAQSHCRFVATATSGTDHIDIEGLHRLGITVVSAQGCNSISVVDYVFSALAALTPIAGRHWRDASVGIIGCGRIGGALAERLLGLGMRVRIFDPLLKPSHPLSACFATLEEVLQQQVITLHVPLTSTGSAPTHHLLSQRQLGQIPSDSVLINAARGAAIDNPALLDWLRVRPLQRVVLDTWENEPDIALELLRRVTLGTPHIAGYSHEGKEAGTHMIQQRFCDHFGFGGPGDMPKVAGSDLAIPAGNESWQQQFDQLILTAYDVRKDHQAMQSLLGSAQPAIEFDRLRKSYPQRREFTHFSVGNLELHPQTVRDAAVLGFRLTQS